MAVGRRTLYLGPVPAAIVADADADADADLRFMALGFAPLEDLDEEQVPPHIHAIVSAIYAYDVDALAIALDNYPGSIDDGVEHGIPILHLCCCSGNLQCVQLAVQRGANMELQDGDRETPLELACIRGSAEIVQFLLSAAGDPESLNRLLDPVDAYGNTLLHLASWVDNVGVINLLLAAGASPIKANVYGQNPAEHPDCGTHVQSILEAAAAAAASI